MPRVLTVTGVITLLLAIAVSGWVFLQPAGYLSKVTMEVRPDGYQPDAKPGGPDPWFIREQMSAICKAEVLEPVIAQLNLEADSGGRGKALQQLLKSLTVQEVRNTGLIEIGVRHRDPQMAANVANAIAVAYRNKRLAALQTAMERGLAQFQDEVGKQRKLVEEAALAMAQIRQREKISDPDPESGDASLTATEANQNLTIYAGAKAKYLQGRRILEAAELRLSTARMEQTIESNPVRIWESAQPAARPQRRWKIL